MAQLQSTIVHGDLTVEGKFAGGDFVRISS